MNYNFQIIKQRRIEKNLTQREIASQLGYKDKTSIYYIENGIKQLPLKKLVQLASILEINPSDLLESQ